MFETLSYYSVLLYKDFNAYTAGALQSLGLSFGSLPFLLYVGKHPLCSPAELTRALGMDWGHCQRTLTKLEEGDFLTREKVGRSYRLQLTESGSHAFTMSHQVFSDWDRARMQNLTAQEQDTLLGILQKLTGEMGGPHHV